MVEFEGVYMNAEVWLNDNFLGRHPYGYTSFHLDLTPYLRWDEVNALRVGVDNSHQLNSRWYSGSGIYRPVWLLVGDPVRIAPWGLYVTTPTVEDNVAKVQVETRIINDSGQSQTLSVHAQITRPDGAEGGEVATTATVAVGGETSVVQTIEVAEPALWSPENPALYQLEATLLVEGQVRDRAATPFGIRTIAFNVEEGFLLNGRPLLLKGGCVHHDNGILGAAAYPRAEERKVALHKNSGYNAIRCAHNPPAPSFLDACDRLGMLVIDEAFDCWREGKNAGDYHVAFDDWWQRDLDSMLYRDRNHPSVIMWSIGNEILERDGRGGGVAIARALAEHVCAVDPTRPVTAGINGSWTGGEWEEMDGVFATLDVGGYNYQRERYRPDHERHPERMMKGTESFPLAAWENWQEVVALPYVIGDFVWTSLDYLGEAGIGRVHFQGEPAPHLGDYPWHQANCGDLDLCGWKRPQSYYRDMLWQEKPGVYLAVHTPLPEGKTLTISRWGWPDVWPRWNWEGHEGEALLIDVYSSCDTVELFLNGESVGRQQLPEEGPPLARFNVPYRPGELRAVGYVQGEQVAEHAVRTAGSPAALRLTPDRAALSAGERDLSYVTV
ncbi:MAG TPA: glycoside hydrolase family 2 TIM barrel-domain containing protein, partial [Candidatus Sulfomarinibacteraceae bacterium]|nr:glycoside hydrolase family 2 TIM barrel-domain containing protein [Candidatus Sulfomarinibacteraceae bacterium]